MDVETLEENAIDEEPATVPAPTIREEDALAPVITDEEAPVVTEEEPPIPVDEEAPIIQIEEVVISDFGENIPPEELITLRSGTLRSGRTGLDEEDSSDSQQEKTKGPLKLKYRNLGAPNADPAEENRSAAAPSEDQGFFSASNFFGAPFHSEPYFPSFPSYPTYTSYPSLPYPAPHGSISVEPHKGYPEGDAPAPKAPAPAKEEEEGVVPDNIGKSNF